MSRTDPDAPSVSVTRQRDALSERHGAEITPRDDGSVRKPVINLESPCENLPLLSQHDLGFIGQCVTVVEEATLIGEQVFLRYEGMVLMVNKDTVILMNVRRYSDLDFLKHEEEMKRERERRGGARRRRRLTRETSTRGASHESPSELCALDDRDVAQEDDIRAGNGSANADGEAGGAVFLLPASARECHGLSKKERASQLTGSVTTGPMPFVTLSRCRIHAVTLSDDPRPVAYRILRDPSMRCFDMQYLRMHVRRFLVLSSQGKGSPNVPLRPFIEEICDIKNTDGDLLVNLAEEELGRLVNAERDMKRNAERNGNGRSEGFDGFRQPNGFPGDTPLLFLSKIPVNTFCVAVLELIVAFFLLSFSAYSLASAPPIMIYDYVKGYTFPVMFSGVVSFFASSLTALHSIKMRLPYKVTIYSVLRFSVSTLSIAFNLMIMIMMSRAFATGSIKEYVNIKSSSPEELCAYYESNNCRGYAVSCGGNESHPMCLMEECPGPLNVPCTRRLFSTFARTFVMFLMFSCILVSLFMVDHFLHCRLVRISRMLIPL
ncbi:hypothetical protein ERJ75_000705200 [Trypanosoma vivax]|uniref:Uncharacterized protein n=1 Tax=Trypanosoma vivax (strain Y486) TaxID=1055687 RepID=G0TU35_TRYVY|nr:hypothetical protein ERJ75_000705200 [Trypanosoma vivax]CCC47469.1 conserved hypothetical protein [Trypanosoma vivax Y486]